ncbi:MAG: putative 4-hydroxybenzoate polyprenyltransferase [Bacteroidetes bacterium]|nr:putative 4-hydroxybenzoate polyprenyltransferase [Bacteroidota bacterium]
MNWNRQWKKVARFLKIEHTLFSLPLIFAGVLLAAKQIPPLYQIVLILLAAVGARTVALSLNRIIDRHIDAKNPRTSNRELPRKTMKVSEALIVMCIGLLFYIGSAALISPFCLLLSPIPLLVFAVYPYLKRFTPLVHFGVGLGLAMAPLGGWLAVTCTFDGILPGALLALFMFFWASGFDVIYATLDEEFDKKEKLYSLVATYGKEKALKISAMLHVLSFCVLSLVWALYLHNVGSLLLLLLSGYLLYLEHKNVDNVELAFFRINALNGFVILGMVIVGIYFS